MTAATRRKLIKSLEKARKKRAAKIKAMSPREKASYYAGITARRRLKKRRRRYTRRPRKVVIKNEPQGLIDTIKDGQLTKDEVESLAGAHSHGSQEVTQPSYNNGVPSEVVHFAFGSVSKELGNISLSTGVPLTALTKRVAELLQDQASW